MKNFGMIFVLLLLISGCHQKPSIPTVKNFDLNRYLGVWYEAARLPNSFEHGMSEVQAEYMLNSDGTLRIVNSGMRNGERKFVTGVGKTTTVPGELLVSFFRPFYGSYRVAALAPDYSSALVVSNGSRRYLWILSRTPELDKKVLQVYLELAARYGFDTSKMIYSSSNSGFSVGM